MRKEEDGRWKEEDGRWKKEDGRWKKEVCFLLSSVFFLLSSVFFLLSCSVFVAFEGRLDAGDLHVLRRNGGRLAAALAFLDLADADEDVRFKLVEFFLAHLAELDAHLSLEQALAQRVVVVHLPVDGRRDLVEHEPDARDDQRVDNEHD